MSYIGEFQIADTFDTKFTTVGVSGAPTTMVTGTVAAYVNSGTTEITAGVTLTADFDGRSGLNHIRVVATTGNGFATGTDCQLVLTAGTVGGTSVAGYVVGEFSISHRVVASVIGNVTGDVVGNVRGNVTGTVASVLGAVTGDVIGNVRGNVTGSVASVLGAVTGDVIGNVRGSVTGNVGGDVIGNVRGNVTGNVGGDVVGNVRGNVTGTVASVLGAVTGDIIGNVRGSVTGNVGGDVIGNVRGNVTGSIGSVGAGGIAVTSFAAGAIDAAAIAANAIGASELASDAVTEIQTAILNDATPFSGASIALIKARTDNLPEGIKKNTALAAFEFLMTDATGTGITGATVTGARSIDGGAFGACANTPATEVANGIYKLDLASGDLNGNVITLKLTSATSVATFITIKTGV